MSRDDDTNFEIVFDDWIRQVVTRDIRHAIGAHLDDTSLCCSQLYLYREAPGGFQKEWHREGHLGACRYCRSAARAAFRHADPGFWTLTDRADEARPLWWRQAIEDYLETAPPLVRFVAASQSVLRQGKIAFRPEYLSAKPVPRLAVKGNSTMEGSNYDGQYPRTRVASTIGENGLLAALWLVHSVPAGSDTEPEEAGLVIEVTDLDVGSNRTVQAGLTARRTLLLPVVLQADFRGIVRGEVSVTLEQASKLLGADSGELQVLPPVELPEEIASDNAGTGADGGTRQ